MDSTGSKFVRGIPDEMSIRLISEITGKAGKSQRYASHQAIRKLQSRVQNYFLTSGCPFKSGRFMTQQAELNRFRADEEQGREEGMENMSMNEILLNLSKSQTVTVAGVSNAHGGAFYGSGMQSVKSFSVGGNGSMRSRPLNEEAVRVGNSLIDACVPESQFRRDNAEEL